MLLFGQMGAGIDFGTGLVVGEPLGFRAVGALFDATGTAIWTLAPTTGGDSFMRTMLEGPDGDFRIGGFFNGNLEFAGQTFPPTGDGGDAFVARFASFPP